MTASRGDPSNGANDFPGYHFGTQLRRLRKRVLQFQPVDQDGEVAGIRSGSAKAVCRFLEARGYQISMHAYRDIEAARKLPASCPLFLEAIAECFSLHDEEVELLTLLLARDILHETLGHEVTDALLGDGPNNDGFNWL